MTPGGREQRVFAAVADTLWPADPAADGAARLSASELGVVDRVGEIAAALPTDADRRRLSLLLRLLDTPAGAGLFCSAVRPFPALDAREREAAWRRMTASRLGMRRTAATSLKALLARLLVTPPAGAAAAPVWAAMGYPGPDEDAPRAPARPLVPVGVERPSVWDADVVVVGSGAGGGVAAGVLADAGLDVVVLERGPYRSERDFDHVETRAYGDLYLDGGFAATSDLGVALLAGACLGGGTTVNYTTSLPTPARVRAEWDALAGFRDVFTGGAFVSSTAAVEERLGVNREHGWPSRRDELLESGLRAMGWRVASQPRNVDGCRPEACGWCGFGCRVGAKRSTARTWLEDAAERGARLVVGCDVQRVLVRRGRAVGVAATVAGVPLTVRARAVVVAGGALCTPALLQRSAIGGRAVGHNLHLHPVTAVWGRFAEHVDPWTGVLQARYSDEFADLDGEGFGFLFETAPIHPLLPTAFFGWRNGLQYKRDVLAYRHWSPVGILLRDRDGGRVTVTRDGRPRWRYRVSKRDRAHVREGIRRGAQVLAAAGAVEVVAPTTRPVVWRPGGREPLERWLNRVDSVGYGSGQTVYVSFHQMGSARMGADSRVSVVDARNELHDVRGAFVLDASCFPSASGVNPMLSVQAVAHRGASTLAAALR